MKPELEEKFRKWKGEAFYNTRQVEIIRKLTTGEYIVLITERAEFFLEEDGKIVEARKLFQTKGQARDNESNLRGDLYAFDLLANSVAKAYLDECSEMINQWIKEKLR